MSENNVAFIFDDLTEFFTMRKAIDRLKKEGIPVDIIVPYDSGYNNLAKHTIQKIKELGYSPKDDAPANKKYKILLTPYPGLDVVKRTNFVYHLRYPYSPLSTKPIPLYEPNYTIYYDALFSFNTYDTELRSAYGSRIHPIPCWRYHNFKKVKKKNAKEKPVLLVLPTFGEDISCIESFTQPLIDELKQHYYVITKAHHATHFSIDGKDRLANLKAVADEFYDSDTPINELLKVADVTLSDNSGAIFESLYAGVPVVLFAPNINSRRLGKLNTPQYEFTQQGFFPYAQKPEQLMAALSSVDKFKKKQATLKKQIFPEFPKDPIKPFVDVIKYYLESDADKDGRKILHDRLVQEWQDNRRQVEDLTKAVEALKKSTSWKVTRPLRKLKDWRK